MQEENRGKESEERREKNKLNVQRKENTANRGREVEEGGEGKGEITTKVCKVKNLKVDAKYREEKE